MPFDIPVIETRRLILRGPEPQDYPDFKATFSSYRSRFMGGPLNPYEAWMLYAAEIGHWQVRGFGMWMIHDKNSGETYGMAAWLAARRLARARDRLDHLARCGLSKGYALEAAHAARGHFYSNLGWETAVSYIDPKNLDSIRLAERLGAKKDHEAATIDGNDAVYRHPAPDALKDSQTAHGIDMEIAHYADPLFKPEGWAID